MDHLPSSLPGQDDHCANFCPVLLFTHIQLREAGVCICIVVESLQICKATQTVRLCGTHTGGFPSHTAAAFTLSLLVSAVCPLQCVSPQQCVSYSVSRVILACL